jgi:hypothetical protein
LAADHVGHTTTRTAQGVNGEGEILFCHYADFGVNAGVDLVPVEYVLNRLRFIGGDLFDAPVVFGWGWPIV